MSLPYEVMVCTGDDRTVIMDAKVSLSGVSVILKNLTSADTPEREKFLQNLVGVHSAYIPMSKNALPYEIMASKASCNCVVGAVTG